ncbi:hypothetical protein Noda2021_06770 [Candidatus Dependentiae bacterium Noda2021]|nr:hypothetical protein Noda2021_06770 [Candidatus Dependentiae bacterium Noda2021]
MTTSQQNLNLARKWRSKTFDQLIGQNLCVKILKNSLYRGHYFPVYLFAGQRGCGKTSTARIFAAAINCEQLPVFQKEPRTSTVPCLECYSCRAMQQGNHPDFIEIDAASHTGVDNVRSIIDSSSFLPLMGRKKIYLIDEAHMLSRAAFNAFLKIMEEPPASVLFILATTDTQKIIETVRSRCFQLFFKPVENQSLHQHLATICEQEHISIDQGAIDCIINQTGGSVRDALNLLEQVRFSSGRIDKKSVLAVLGHIDDAHIIALLEVVLYKRPVDVLSLIARIDVANYNAERVWNRLTEAIRAAVWVKCGVQPQLFTDHIGTLKKLVSGCPLSRLQELLTVLYEYEPLFLKTTAQHSLLEVVLLSLCHKKNSNDSTGGVPSVVVGSAELDEDDIDADEEDHDDDQEEETIAQFDSNTAWRQFVSAVEQLKDPLLNSIFKQGVLKAWHETEKIIDIEFSREFVFFNEWLQKTTHIWMPLLQEHYDQGVVFNPLFTAVQAQKQQAPVKQPVVSTQPVTFEPKKNVVAHPQPVAKSFNNQSRFYPKAKSRTMPAEAVVDVSDAHVWKNAHLLMNHFPGIVTEVRENFS